MPSRRVDRRADRLGRAPSGARVATPHGLPRRSRSVGPSRARASATGSPLRDRGATCPDRSPALPRAVCELGCRRVVRPPGVRLGTRPASAGPTAAPDTGIRSPTRRARPSPRRVDPTGAWPRLVPREPPRAAPRAGWLRRARTLRMRTRRMPGPATAPTLGRARRARRPGRHVARGAARARRAPRTVLRRNNPARPAVRSPARVSPALPRPDDRATGPASAAERPASAARSVRSPVAAPPKGSRPAGPSTPQNSCRPEAPRARGAPSGCRAPRPGRPRQPRADRALETQRPGPLFP